MSDADKPRVPLAIICGVFCLIVGLAQFLYSFLAFASVIFVDLLGIGLTIASSAIAAVPDKPIEIPYARAPSWLLELGARAVGFLNAE